MHNQRANPGSNTADQTCGPHAGDERRQRQPTPPVWLEEVSVLVRDLEPQRIRRPAGRQSTSDLDPRRTPASCFHVLGVIVSQRHDRKRAVAGDLLELGDHDRE